MFNYWVFYYTIRKNILHRIFLILVFLFISISDLFPQKKTDVSSFEIDEIKIIFKRTQSFESEDIKNILAAKEGDDFDYPIFLQDVERIRKFYFDAGFFDAKVDTALVFNKEDDEVVEKFFITENQRYKYQEITYLGLDSTDDYVKNLIQNQAGKLIFAGKYYSKDTVKLEATRILNLLFNNGYATASAENPVVLKYETNNPNLTDKVRIILSFIPKLKYVFGSTSVVFIGKQYNITKSDILRELTYSENQVYNKQEVINSELNLTKISLMENPRISIDRIDSTNKKIYLSINAIIRNKYDLTPEVFGYYFQQVFYLGSGLTFSDKNFFGGGRVLKSSLRFYFHSLNDNRLEFINSLYQPFLFNNRNITGNWNIGAEYRLNEEYNLTEIKNSFGVIINLPTYTYINNFNSIWEISNQRLILKTLDDIAINYFISTITLTAIHNTTNNIQFPFSGSFQSYEFEESGLLSGLIRKWFNTASLSYFKLSNFNSKYFNLSRRDDKVSSTLAVKFSNGVIFEYGDNSFDFNGISLQSNRIPNDKKFVCGGSASVRGWGAKQLGIVVDKSVGGNFIFESSVEHRIRPFLNAENIYFRDLGFATFMDFGNVWSEIGKFKINEIAWAAGAGLRYYTIIGAIRFDVGLKVYDPQPGPVGGSNWLFGSGANFNDKYNLQFGIGNTF